MEGRIGCQGKLGSSLPALLLPDAIWASGINPDSMRGRAGTGNPGSRLVRGSGAGHRHALAMGEKTPGLDHPTAAILFTQRQQEWIP